MSSGTNGKICYLELPANDAAVSAGFYATVFNWKMRQRGDGQTAFDDTTGAVSGAFVTNRVAGDDPGLTVYIMCDSVAPTLDAIVANGGEAIQRIGGDAPEIRVRFRDPAGNVLGLYQEPG